MARHLPVQLEHCLEFLAPERGGVFVDCTVGLGGHSAALLERFPGTRVLGLDRDPEALRLAGERLAAYEGRCELALGRFDELGQRLAERGVAEVAGVLADLGVSSYQLDTPERGFSFSHEGPLDMRMGDGDVTAEEIINGYPEETLAKIFREYGEEPRARRVAREIVRRREEKSFADTADLARFVEETLPTPPYRRRGRSGRRVPNLRRIHPATRVFQALRIEVNRELDQVEQLLDEAVGALETDGRLVVISYHSLEDRIVKHRLRDLATGEIEPITGRPRAETQVIEVLTKKPLRPTDEEVAANPRARSAKLRAARRL